MKSRTLATMAWLFASCLLVAAEAHCRCKVAPVQDPSGQVDGVVKDLGDTSYPNQNQNNRDACKQVCETKWDLWTAAANQGEVCAAFGTAKVDKLRAYAALGIRKYDWVGATIEPPPTSTLVLDPEYYVLTILYAPPGCTATSSYPCTSQSSAVYSTGSSTSTTASIENSFSSGHSLTADGSLTFPIKGALKLGLSMSTTNAFSVTSTSDRSETVTKGSSESLTVNAPSVDGIDHTQDVFYLLLDPRIVLTNDCIKYGTGTGWNLGFKPPFQVVHPLLACQILNQCPWPDKPAFANFKPSDYCAILSQDPFVQHCAGNDPATQSLSNLTPAPDPTVDPETVSPGRFQPTTFEPAYVAPVGGTCNVVWFDTISNDFQASSTSTVQTETSYSVSLGATISVSELFSFGLTGTQTATLTNSVSKVNAQTGSQTATATIACSGSDWKGDDQIAIYWDSLFGSFLFRPMTSSGMRRIHQGHAAYQSGVPVANQVVELFYGGKTYHTSTNNQGDYSIYSSAIQADPEHPLPAKVTVGGVSMDVTLGSGTTAVLIQALPPTVTIETAETTTTQRQVRLKAIASDPGGLALKYKWSANRSAGKIRGDTAIVDFQLAEGPGPYVFTVTVTNIAGMSATASTTVNYVGR